MKRRQHPVGITEWAQMYADFQADSILITEGLLYSYSPGSVFAHLKHSFNFYQSQISYITGTGCSGYFEVKIYRKDLGLLDSMVSSMNNVYGWFPSYMLSETMDKKFSEEFLNEFKEELETQILDEFVIRFEAKFSIVKDQKMLPDYIYHVTLKTKLEKIKRIGLKPSSESKQSNHPERIYFTLSLNDARKLIPVFVKNKKGITTFDDYCILKIHVPTLYPGILFYEDPMFMFFEKIGVYTMSNINPGTISLTE